MKFTPTIQARLALFVLILIVTPYILAFNSRIPLSSACTLARIMTDDHDCADLCDWKKKLTTPHIVIDANTGEIVDGSTRFEKEESVQVVFINLNPFKYKYRFQLVSESLETSIIKSFLGLFMGDLQAFKTLTDQPPTPAPTPCTTLQTATDLSQESDKIEADLGKETKAVDTVRKSYKDFVDETTPDKLKDCPKVCREAYSLSQQLGALDLKALNKTLDEIDGRIGTSEKDGTFANKVEKLKQEAKNPKGTCSATDVASILQIVSSLEKNVDKFKKGVADLKKLYVSFDKMTDILKSALNTSNISGSPFYEISHPQLVGGPTLVTISIFRTNQYEENATEKSVATIKLQIGESAVSLSAGIGFSSIPDRRIIRQAGLVDDGKGGKKLANVFGFENNSQFKPSGVFMLNAHLFHFKPKNYLGPYTFGPSSGVVISNRNGTSEFEYIAGGSLGFLRNNVFLTLGFHAARVEKLAGGFTIGQEIPADLKDPLPIEKNWHKGVMFSITYKIK